MEEKTEGWVTGLRLAALSMRHRGDLYPKLLEPQVGAQYVMEYLFSEVLSHQPPEISQLLMGSAILDRFCGPLCQSVCLPGDDSLTSDFGGWNFIGWLKKENLFLIPLEAENRWFRYHHLFRKLLQNQLKRHYNTNDINALHSRASRWFAENGLVEEAFKHTLAAGDIPQAIKLVGQYRYDLMNREQWQRLDRLLRLLPAKVVEKTPMLLLTKAWSCERRSRLQEAHAYVDRAAELISQAAAKPSENQVYRSEIDALSANRHFLSAQGDKAVATAKRALRMLPVDAHSARIYATANLVFGLQMMGDLNQGVNLIQQMLENKSMRDAGGQRARLWLLLTYLYCVDGSLREMKQTALQFTKSGETFNLT